MEKRKLNNIGLIFFILPMILGGCLPNGDRQKNLTPITVQLLWTHNAEFAGFYAADQNGYYADEGLAVTLREGGLKVDYLTPIVEGTAQFGDAGADELLLARAGGKPLVALATIYRRSPSAFVSLADSGITRPKDFIGKSIRITPQSATRFHAMMARAGIRPDQYTEVTLPSDLSTFKSGQAQVWAMYVNNFAVTVQQAGYKLNFIYPDDYGVHFYADSIFTSDDFLAKNPELVQRFLRATLKGWTYAVENPTKISAMIVKYQPNIDLNLETAKMAASLPMINTGEDHIGWMKPEIWAGMEKTLTDEGLLTSPQDITQAYTMKFLEEIYKP